MWLVLKAEKKNYGTLKNELSKKVGKELIFYYPKFKIKRFVCNKIIGKETDLLGGYVFCFHKSFKDINKIKNLKYTKGLQYILDGYDLFQSDINIFVSKCRENEDSFGFLTQNFLELCVNSDYKFSSGPFADKMFNSCFYLCFTTVIITS